MVALRRSLSLWQLTLMSVGIILGAGIYVILGAGIYVVIGEAAGLSGNYIWLSFIIAAFVAALTAFSYAELSSRFPKAGAEYVYVENSFGNRTAWLVAWLLLAGSIIGGATVAMGFSQYFSAIFNTPVIAIALIMIVIILITFRIINRNMKCEEFHSVPGICTILSIPVASGSRRADPTCDA